MFVGVPGMIAVAEVFWISWRCIKTSQHTAPNIHITLCPVQPRLLGGRGGGRELLLSRFSWADRPAQT